MYKPTPYKIILSSVRSFLSENSKSKHIPEGQSRYWTGKVLKEIQKQKTTTPIKTFTTEFLSENYQPLQKNPEPQ